MRNRLFFPLIMTMVFLAAMPLSQPALASPGLQGGGDAPQEEETPPDGNSTGDTIDMSQQKNNLGTVMSGSNQQSDDDGDDNDDDGDDGDDNDDDTGDTDDTGTWHHPVADAIASFFDASYDEVFGLHEQGNGFGTIVKAYFLAETIGGIQPGELLIEAKASGWGNVLKDNGIHPGNAGNNKNKTTPADDLQGTENQSHGNAPAFAGPGENGKGKNNDRDENNNNGNGKDKGNNGKAKGKDK